MHREILGHILCSQNVQRPLQDHVELGRVTGNEGHQNYEKPNDIDGYRFPHTASAAFPIVASSVPEYNDLENEAIRRRYSNRERIERQQLLLARNAKTRKD
jgi:hypothetical protein